MSDPTEDPRWHALFQPLFGRRRTADERLFAAQVMARVRRLQPDLQAQTWHHFLRWAVPILGVSAACLILSVRLPNQSQVVSLDSVLMYETAANADLLTESLEESR